MGKNKRKVRKFAASRKVIGEVIAVRNGEAILRVIYPFTSGVVASAPVTHLKPVELHKLWYRRHPESKFYSQWEYLPVVSEN